MDWNLLVTPVVLILLGLLRRYVPRVPGWLIVILAPAFGVLFDGVAAHFLTSWEGHGPAVSAGLGMLATYFHQLGKQSMKQTETKELPAEAAPPQ